MAYENLRAFIPSGHCVPPPSNAETPGNAYEVFQKTDHGFANELLLRVAQEACLSCIQRPWCEEQRDSIASELWRVGVKHPMIAAERVEGAEPPHHVTTELINARLKFDLSELPKDPPERFLGFLRQGIRAGQLSIMTPPSPNILAISQEYHEMLGARHPETLTRLNTTLTDGERRKAYRYISVVLCQQANFKKTVSPQRYWPEAHDFETYYPTVRLYIDETTAIKNKGYLNPGQMAIRYDPTYCDNLLEHFGQDVALRTRFFDLVLNYINDPVTALTAFLAKVQSHRASGGGTITNIRRRAWANKPAKESPSEDRRRAELQAEHATLSPAAVEGALARYEDPASKIQTVKGKVDRLLDVYGKDHRIVTPRAMKVLAETHVNYEKEAEAYIERFEALEKLYKGDSDFLPSTLKRIALQYTDSLQEAVNYKKRLELYRSWSKASDYKLTDAHLRECARRDFSSYEDIVKLRMVVRLRARFKARRKRDETQPIVDTWMLNRIAALYPWEEIDKAGEGLHELLGQGILTSGVAELKILQDPFAVFDANDVADPRTKKYLTFSAMLQDLTSQERLMIARDYNLTPLLYGRRFSRGHVDLFLGAKASDGDIVALPSTAVETSEKKTSAPLPAAIINRDILNVLRTIPAPEAGEKYAQEAYDLVTIVGAALVQVPQVELNEQRLQGAISADQKQWLQRGINGSYPPADRRQKIKEIESALCAGRVVVRGDAAATYQLALADSFYTTSLSDLERAVIAQVSGVDRLLYDQDVSLMLKYRLDITDLVDYLTTDILPRIGSWKSIEAVAAELQLEESNVEDIAREEMQGSQVWYARGRIIAVSSDALASLGDRQRTAAAKIEDEPELDQPVEPELEPESEPPELQAEQMEPAPEPKGYQPDVVAQPPAFSDKPSPEQGHRPPDFSHAPARHTLDSKEIGRAILASRPPKPYQPPTSAPALPSAEMPQPGASQQPPRQSALHGYKEVHGRLRQLGAPCNPGVMGIVMQDCNLPQAFIQEVDDGYHAALEATIQRLADQIRRYPLATPELETPQDLARRLGVRLPDVVRASKEVNIKNMRTVSGLYRSVDERGHPRPLAMYYKPVLVKLIERRIGSR